ncbi:tetraspanin-6-like [Ischnura elegans]|uniref:tetraspanin-6-like n=1 Tax=Ischnura elegans TaxID=197161 RepID=UPI001ED8A15C|nr:tetraspanin-6-like [Ischnura elegans]
MDFCDIPPVKELFCLFNMVFAASGAILIIAGSVVTSRLSSSAASSFLPLAVLAPPAFIIALGVVSLSCVLMALPLCKQSEETKTQGSPRWSKNIEFSPGRKGRVAAYATILCAVAFTELVTGSVSLSTRKHYNRALREAMEDSLYRYPNDSDTRMEWDRMQQKLQCCGVFNPGEWLGHPRMANLPPSCCEVENPPAAPPPQPPPQAPRATNSSSVTKHASSVPHSIQPACSFLWGHDVFHSGCFRKIRKVVDSSTVAIGGVSVAMAVIKIGLASLGLLMARLAIRRYRRV